MAWALVTEIQRNIGMWITIPDGGTDPAGNPVSVTIWEDVLCIPGTITSLIILEEGHDYIVPETYRLVEVPDSAKIGDAGY